MKSAMEKVADAAIAWNRARLQRIVAAKCVQVGVVGYSAEEHRLRVAKKSEAQAKAYLRKMCAKADPSCLVFDVVAHQQMDKQPALDVNDM